MDPVEPFRSTFSLAGWVFADLMLVLAILFLATNQRFATMAEDPTPPPTLLSLAEKSTATPTPVPPTEEPTATLPPTAIPTDVPTATLPPTAIPTDVPTATSTAEPDCRQVIMPEQSYEFSFPVPFYSDLSNAPDEQRRVAEERFLADFAAALENELIATGSQPSDDLEIGLLLTFSPSSIGGPPFSEAINALVTARLPAFELAVTRPFIDTNGENGQALVISFEIFPYVEVCT